MTADRQPTFEALWAEHHQAVLGYAMRRIDAHAAHDVVAETFLVAWRRLDEPARDRRAWLIGVARHVLANQHRAARRQDALADLLAVQAATLTPESGDLDRELLHALAALDADDREALLLTAWDGLSGTQAAEVLGVGVSAFWVRAHRARLRLRRELAALGGPLALPEPDAEVSRS